MRRLRPSTVQNKVIHVGEKHVEIGKRNPLDAMPRVRKALRSLKRLPCSVRRKFPAGPSMVRHARYRARGWSARTRLASRAALSAGFCFLLRCGEYLSRGRAGWDEDKAFRGKHLSFRRNGKRLQPSTIASCKEVTPWVPASEANQFKANQFNQGQSLVHHITEEDQADLCVVWALKGMCLAFPRRLVEKEELPLVRWEDGAPISRVQIRKILGDAGKDLGVARKDTGTPSLRIAGVTAVYSATGGSKGKSQRLGR